MEQLARPPVFDATIAYVQRTAERPVMAVDEIRMEIEPTAVVMRDARSLSETPSLAREGFMLADAPSLVTDFEDREQVETRYFAEIAEYVQRLTGAARVLVYPTYIYRQSRLDADGGQRRMPAGQGAHIDFTDNTATQFLSVVADPVRALRDYGRIAIFQTWRAISGGSQDVPLAVTDGRTVRPGDLVAADTRVPAELGPITEFEFYLSTANHDHRWYYYRDMKPDELLVFQGYDFSEPGRLRVLHTAFTDETCPAGVPPRRSIEVRTFAFFDR